MTRSIEKEVELLLKRQSVGSEKTPENELSLVERLEEELKKKKQEAKKALKEKKEAEAKKLGMEILKEYEVSNLEELKKVLLPSNVESNSELDPALVSEISSWIKKLDLWETDMHSNKINYKEFYPTVNELFKKIIKVK
ncbi:hypothetical protein DES36_1328 [Alkalibaculum bacchi]|uniref:Uncharacterized protein n=1 Tax=Alkalibaculum bacchi TaxID=645887 RepID=A0A366HXH6_9FIRM|nr:hypothetical protein [Alkalibaculum bacchi]RBP57165.1 hypothetical protein DES36_1328 [Alkalibaculum bacchi]